MDDFGYLDASAWPGWQPSPDPRYDYPPDFRAPRPPGRAEQSGWPESSGRPGQPGETRQEWLLPGRPPPGFAFPAPAGPPPISGPLPRYRPDARGQAPAGWPADSGPFPAYPPDGGGAGSAYPAGRTGPLPHPGDDSRPGSWPVGTGPMPAYGPDRGTPVPRHRPGGSPAPGYRSADAGGNPARGGQHGPSGGGRYQGPAPASRPGTGGAVPPGGLGRSGALLGYPAAGGGQFAAYQPGDGAPAPAYGPAGSGAVPPGGLGRSGALLGYRAGGSGPLPAAAADPGSGPLPRYRSGGTGPARPASPRGSRRGHQSPLATTTLLAAPGPASAPVTAHVEPAREPARYDQGAYDQPAYDQPAYDQAAHDRTVPDHSGLASPALLAARPMAPAGHQRLRDQPGQDQLTDEESLYDESFYDEPQHEQSLYGSPPTRRSRGGDQAARASSADPERAVAAHVREEPGIDPDGLPSPRTAAVASLASFTVGALLPLAPFLVGFPVLSASLATAGATAFAGGAAVASLTGRPRLLGGLRQFTAAFLATGAAFLIGHLVGAHVGHH